MAREPAASLHTADYATLYLLRWLPKGWPARELRVAPGRSASLTADVARRALRGRGVDPAHSGQALNTLLDLAVPACERHRFAELACEEVYKWNTSVADYVVHVAPPAAVMQLYAECWVLETALRLAAHDASLGRERPGAGWFSFRTWYELALVQTGESQCVAKSCVLDRLAELDVEQTAVDRWGGRRSKSELGGPRGAHPGLLGGWVPSRALRPARAGCPRARGGHHVARWGRTKPAMRPKLMFQQMFDRFAVHGAMLDDQSHFHLPRPELCRRIAKMGIRDPALYTMVHERLVTDPELSPAVRRACGGLTLSPHEYLLERQRGHHAVHWSPRLKEADDLVLAAGWVPDHERKDCWRKALALCEEELRNESTPAWLVYALAYALRLVLGESPPRAEWRNQVLRLRGFDLAQERNCHALLNWAPAPRDQLSSK